MILKMMLRIACMPVMAVVLVVHIVTAVVIGLSAIVTNVLGMVFLVGACAEWIAQMPPALVWQAAGTGIFLLLAPHMAGWINAKAAAASGLVLGMIMP